MLEIISHEVTQHGNYNVNLLVDGKECQVYCGKAKTSADVNDVTYNGKKLTHTQRITIHNYLRPLLTEGK